MTPKPITIKCRIDEDDTIVLSVDPANPQEVMMDWGGTGITTAGSPPVRITIGQAAVRKLHKALWVYMHTEEWPYFGVEATGINTSKKVEVVLGMNAGGGDPNLVLLRAGVSYISVYLNQKSMQDLTKFLGKALT